MSRCLSPETVPWPPECVVGVKTKLFLAGAFLDLERGGFVGCSGGCCPVAPGGAGPQSLWDQAVCGVQCIDLHITVLRFTALFFALLLFFFF